MIREKPLLQSLYGLTVESPFVLPGAMMAAPGNGDADVRIVWSPALTEASSNLRILAPPDGIDDLSVGIDDNGAYVLLWPRLQIAIPANGRQLKIACTGIELENAPTVIAGIGLGILLHVREMLCLHGSVVTRNGRTIAVLGRSGSGKSTLAGAMIAEGANLHSEEPAVLQWNGGNRVTVAAGSRALRLNDDSAEILVPNHRDLTRTQYDRKLLWVQPSGPEDRPVRRLDALYWLEPAAGQEPSIRQLPSAQEKLQFILASWYPPSCFRLITQQRLRQMTKLAAAACISVVRYDQSWANLRTLARELLV